nr:phospho-N-acetylmuramoyl-pentapeptide-transferase homolog [Ipomoea batatas]
MWDNNSIHLHPHRPWPHLPSPTTTSLPPLDDEDDDQRPDFSPVGSPDFHEDLPQQHSDQPHRKTKVWRESDPDRHTCGQTSDQAVDEENRHGDSHDEEDFDFSSTDDWGGGGGGGSDAFIGYGISSSEGEESDGEIRLKPITDVDLPTTKEKSYPADDSITVTAHRLTMLGRHAGEESTANLPV